MILEFVADPSFNFLASFAEKFGLPVQGDSLTIPAQLGEGVIRKIEGNPVVAHVYPHDETYLTFATVSGTIIVKR